MNDGLVTIQECTMRCMENDTKLSDSERLWIWPRSTKKEILYGLLYN